MTGGTPPEKDKEKEKDPEVEDSEQSRSSKTRKLKSSASSSSKLPPPLKQPLPLPSELTQVTLCDGWSFPESCSTGEQISRDQPAAISLDRAG